VNEKTIVIATAVSCCMGMLLAAAAEEERSKADEMTVAVHVEIDDLLPVINGQLEALRKGSTEKAYQDFTSRKFRKTTSLEQFNQLVDKYQALSKNRLYQYNSFYVEDGIATFEGNLISEEGESLATEFDLIEENGSWKILGIQVFRQEMAYPPRQPE